VTSPLIVPIAEALEADWNTHTVQYTRSFLADGATAADACIAVIAALPADYTAVDVLAFLRGEDVPPEPLPARAWTCDHCDKPQTGGAAGGGQPPEHWCDDHRPDEYEIDPAWFDDADGAA